MHRRRKHTTKAAAQSGPRGKHWQKNQDGPRLVCPLCPETFSERKFFGRHLRKIHDRSLSEFPAESMKWTTPATDSAEAHPLPPEPAAYTGPRVNDGFGHRHNYNANGRHACPLCPLTYKTRNILGNHVRHKHNQSLREQAPNATHHAAKVGRPRNGSPNGIAPMAAIPNMDVTALDLINVWKQERNAMKDTLAKIEAMIQGAEKILYGAQK
jgi:hypothetical protein